MATTTSMVEVGHTHIDYPESAKLTLSERTLLSLQAAYRHTTTTVSSVLGIKRIKYMLSVSPALRDFLCLTRRRVA